MINDYKQIQNIANDVLIEIKNFIKPDITERALVEKTIALIKAKGVTEFWYHNIPAIVAVSDQTVNSVSGKDYQPTNLPLQETDFVTIDLSVARNNHWAIRGRSFALENGEVKTDNFKIEELQTLQCSSDFIHHFLTEVATPTMTFHELYHELKAKVFALGVEHLDFKNNFGHSIEKALDDRIYIADGVTQKLGDRELFSFEPHLKFPNGKYGFKDADIYYFAQGRPVRL
jgi:methionine aminopeptidase